jgi:F0F1-type ATP synthase membrane subunit b/b'
MMCNVSLIFFFIISAKTNFVYANSPVSGTNINWFQLGSEYMHSPAIGWCFFTFIIFFLITFYFLYFYIINLLKIRHNDIKTMSISIRKKKALLNQKLLLYKQNNKNLNTLARKIIFKTYNNLKTNHKKHKAEFLIFSENLHSKFFATIHNHVFLVKNHIKNSFVKQIVKDVIKQNKDRILKNFHIDEAMQKQLKCTVKNILHIYCKGK